MKIRMAVNKRAGGGVGHWVLEGVDYSTGEQLDTSSKTVEAWEALNKETYGEDTTFQNIEAGDVTTAYRAVLVGG